MRKLFDFIKRHSWIWVLIIVLIAVIGDSLLSSQQKTSPSPTPIPQKATFKDVVPGISNESDLNKVLGTPIKSTTNNGVTTDEYKSASPVRKSIGIIENGKVSLIKQIIGSSENITADSVTNIYGKAPEILYSKAPNSVFRLYVYPSNGIAYLGHSDGTLLEIWYFVPTSIENFMTQWGQDYQTTQPEPVQ